jgi:hypothetical protein
VGAVLAQDGAPGLRIVNIDEMPKDIAPNRAGLSLLVSLDPGEHPLLFADCCTLSVDTGGEVRCYEPDMDIGPNASLLRVTMEQGTPLNFTSIRPDGEETRCDGAVVGVGGAVTCFDQPIVIDYRERIVSFADMPLISPGSTLILFVEDASPFAGRQENTGRNYDCG